MAYDLKKIFGLEHPSINKGQDMALESMTISEDPFLLTDSYQNYLQYRIMTRQLQQITAKRELLPGDFEAGYLKLNPELFLTYVHLGEYYQAMDDPEKAFSYYSEAGKKKLPGLDEKNKLTEITSSLKKKLDHGNSRHRIKKP
jgi:hypothetical protein